MGVEQEALFKSDYCNGKNEVVKVFSQKCFIFLENASIYRFTCEVISVFVNTVIKIKVILNC